MVGKISLRNSIIILFVSFFGSCTMNSADVFSFQRKVNETFITEIKNRQFFENVLISPNNKIVAWKERVEGRECWVVNGKKEKKYKKTTKKLVFSEDGKHYAYGARSEKAEFLILDGEIKAQVKALFPSSITISPNGERLAFMGKDDKGYFLWVDGEVLHSRERFVEKSLVFSPDSQKIAYKVIRNQKPVLYINGKEYKTDVNIQGKIYFSPDSREIAFIATDKDSIFVMRNGKKGRKDFYSIVKKSLLFSPDSRKLSYIAANDEKK
jgi:WD40 repeat protein